MYERKTFPRPAFDLRHPGVLLFILVSGIIFLLAMNIVCLRASYEHDPYPFGWKFYFDVNLSYPFFFSSGLLLLGAFYALRLGLSDSSANNFWKGASALLMFIAIDRFSGLHDALRVLFIQNFYHYFIPMIDHYLWATPYLAVGTVATLFLRKYFIALPRMIQKRLLLSACTYCTGAVVFDILGSYYDSHRVASDDHFLTLQLIKTMEEMLQMIGLVMFIYHTACYERAYKEIVTARARLFIRD